MKVLIVSANMLPASPAGAAYIAGAARQAGHEVRVFECLLSSDPDGDLKSLVRDFDPQVIGVSIRLVHGYLVDSGSPWNTRFEDFRMRILDLVNGIRRESRAPIVLGGPGYNYFAGQWLEYLDLDYGIRGEADLSFPLYLERLESGGDTVSVPGAITRRDGEIIETPVCPVEDLDRTAVPAYDLFDLTAYGERGISPAVLTKRGCAFGCTYCPYPALEGRRYRMKSPERVASEIRGIVRYASPATVLFCDNNFNVPRAHAEAVCTEIARIGFPVRWGTGDLRPYGVTREFCSLLKASGCRFINLSVESGSDSMLESMNRGYSTENVAEAFESLSASGIPFSASLMLGAPGETPGTIEESLSFLEQFDIPLGVWVTIGVLFWTDLQPFADIVRRSGQICEEISPFDGVGYISPTLPEEYMRSLVERLKRMKGYTVQVNKPYAGYRRIAC